MGTDCARITKAFRDRALPEARNNERHVWSPARR
jgi:hypothetical protein